MNTLIIPDLRELIANGDLEPLQDFLENEHPAVIAELISTLHKEEVWAVLQYTPVEARSEIYSHLNESLQLDIVKTLRRNEIVGLLTNMSPDDRADLFKNMPEELRETTLPAMAQVEREDIRRLSAYEEGTAGAVMTSDYATLPPKLTALQAIDHLRMVAPNKETIYYSYVIDSNRRILGFVSLKDLIVSNKNSLVDDIMNGEVITAHVDDDQEDAARKIQKLDLIALPVLNENDALVGIITHDDAIDIITQEHTEDMEKFMAISGSHEDAMYMKMSVWKHFCNRSPWVVALAVLGLVSGFIVQNYEGILMQFAILSVFMPMLAGTGGNTGSQSATLVVRALALKEISAKDTLLILVRELGIAFMLALLLGLLAFLRVVVFGAGSTIPSGFSLSRIAFAIAIALGLQVVSSTIIGALLPLIASKFKFDPALIAIPALTTVVDITGLVIYFTTVTLLLGI
ncbi:MAG: magnesium transporter [Spirochaetes bacterium]|jgi:magnesium transporter|nr:magnesium transporter [Spirochaetota bacterium]